MSVVLVVNSGSSSLKYQLVDMSSEREIASGLVERIGEMLGVVTHKVGGEQHQRSESVFDHEQAFRVMIESFAQYGPSLETHPPVAIGHRVVQGGRRFDGPVVVTPKVEQDIFELIPLAPLHNKANLEGIHGAQAAFPDLPQVAVFDTAFHTTLSDASSLYAIDREVAERYRIRKYGAHGTSHKYVAGVVAEFLGRPIADLRTIVLHIGNGASACAVRGGVSVETSMGLTPLEGLVMGTRSGDIDPSVLFLLSRRAGWDVDTLDDFVNRHSGMFGLTGSADLRDVAEQVAAGDPKAKLGLDVYVHRIRHYLGGYLVALGGADAIAWTAGVGEHSVMVRAQAMAGLEWLGVKLDPERNAVDDGQVRRISTDDSTIDVLVVPTNEELEIARQTLEATGMVAAG